MPRLIKKISYDITNKIEDYKNIITIGEISNGYFIENGNFTGFMQYYGVGSDLEVNNFTKIGYSNNNVVKTINVSI